MSELVPTQALNIHRDDCTAKEHVQSNGDVEALDKIAWRETESLPNQSQNVKAVAKAESSGPMFEPASDPWRPIVLSLDGGGIRGLSSLFIIREIMKQIQKLENPYGVSDTNLPLPCHYFDLMIGTDTGGLNAVMLSRLRMDIDDCIREYYIFGNSVFRPHKRKLFRFMSTRFQYSPKKFRRTVEGIVTKYCGCDEQSPACQRHLFRQDDFAEEGDIVSKLLVNKTCKSAVVALREGGKFHDKGGKARAADVPYLFRTYDHRMRGTLAELNPKILEASELTIVEACQATLADPTWFSPAQIRGRRYIGGGVTDHNNPATLAFREANEMARKRGNTESSRTDNDPQVLLSIGAGKPKPPRKIGLYNLLLSAKHRLTDTEGVHEQLQRFFPRPGCVYWRFNVPRSDSSHEERGLDTVGYDTCKKERIKSFQKKSKITESDEVDSFQDADPEDRRGGYNPQKYRYKTYEMIRERTVRYCRDKSPADGDSVAMQIASCAQRLFELSQERRVDHVRWTEFQENPNPRSRASA